MLKVFILSGFVQMGDSEEDSDMDTGFYSDEEEAASPKRRSLLVALRYMCFVFHLKMVNCISVYWITPVFVDCKSDFFEI